MKLVICASILFLCLVIYSEQKSTPQDASYVAAVVEYRVSSDIQLNLDNYISYIQQAAQQDADIIAFPELTLTNNTYSLPVPFHGLLKDYPIPALRPDLYDTLLVGISEAARSNEIYVVVNVRERMECPTEGELCPENKIYIFNTNVVFDRSGAVIDRYRKINLFGEYAHTPALLPELGVFATDFGVTFGHFICFDLMFQVPAVQVVEKNNIKDIVFTTMWFSELPFLTAVQIQEAYAYAMNVNFIGSGANNVAIGSAGSGIYSGKAGALVSIMPGVLTSRLLVARVPKVPGNVTEIYPGPIIDDPADHDELRLIVDPSLASHVSRTLEPGFQEFTIIDREVSCTIRARLNYRNGATTPVFRAFVQDGSNTYVRREIGMATCCVVACKNNDIKSCAYRYSKNEKNAEFQELEIEMRTYRNQFNTTLHCENSAYFPSSFQINKYPLNSKNYTFIDSRQDAAYGNNKIDVYKNNEKELVINKINKPQDELVSFGIYGRIFTRDVDHNKHVSKEDINNFENILNDIFGVKRENNKI